MEQRGAIGILGGMGAEASAYFYRLLIQMAIAEFGASNNDEFPEIVIDSVPVPDFISDEVAMQVALEMLKDRVRRLNHLDLSCLSIACNTAHLLLPQLQEVSRVPFVSMIEAVADRVRADGIRTVVVLGSPSTVRTGLYQSALAERGVSAIQAEGRDLECCEEVIRNVLGGRSTDMDRDRLVEVATRLAARGGQGVILGCTELPLIFPQAWEVPVFSSLDILGRALLHRYYD